MTNTRCYAINAEREREREREISSPCKVILFLAGIAGPAIAFKHALNASLREKMSWKQQSSCKKLNLLCCDGSAHSSGCVVNGSNAMAAV